jgi:uncharacterized membrane protein YraQ (UPF0718 family)
VFNWLQFLVDKLVYSVFHLAKGTHLGDAVDFFIMDTIKIFILLFLIITAVAILRSFLPPDKIRKWLSRKREYAGNVIAAGIGIVTPF